MATQKGLSSSLIVQIVSHLSMTNVTKFLRENLFSFLGNARKTAQGDPRVEIGLKLYFLEVIRDGIYPGEKSINSGQMHKKIHIKP